MESAPATNNTGSTDQVIQRGWRLSAMRLIWPVDDPNASIRLG
jgi:hypothetical protein